MADYVLEQSTDGVWRACAGEQVDQVNGWDDLGRLARDHTLHWTSPNDLSRFRSQYGEPPDDLDMGMFTLR